MVVVYLHADPMHDEFRDFLQRHAPLLERLPAWTIRIVVPAHLVDLLQDAGLEPSVAAARLSGWDEGEHGEGGDEGSPHYTLGIGRSPFATRHPNGDSQGLSGAST